MFRKILLIFQRDLKVSIRDFLTLYIIIVPIMFAVMINVFSPGINDTTVEIALLKGDSQEQEVFFKQFAKIELLDTAEDIEERVKKRDHIVGVLPHEKEDYVLLTQGNEPTYIIDYVKKLTAFYHYDIGIEDSTAEIIDYGRDDYCFKYCRRKNG